MNIQKQSYFTSSTNMEGVKIWLNFLPYAKQLFHGPSNDLWNNPTCYLSVYSQAQELLKSDILNVNVLDFYKEYVNNHGNLVKQWHGKKPTFALKKFLSLTEPLSILLEVLSGLTHLYDGKYPIVLVVPSPHSFLQWLNKIVDPGVQRSVSVDEIDSASMYIADFLRSFSNSGISSIMLEESFPLSTDILEALELYQPISNIANHYQWAYGLCCSELNVSTFKLTDKVNFIIYEEIDISSMKTLWEKEIVSGGGLNSEFWTGEIIFEKPFLKGLTYGTIPVDAIPEMVLERIQLLRL